MQFHMIRVLLGVGTLVLLYIPSFAFGTVLIQQNDSTAESTTGSVTPYWNQYFGTGLSGDFESFSVKIAPIVGVNYVNNNHTGFVKTTLAYNCDGSYLSCSSVVLVSNSQLATTSFQKQTITFSTSTQITFDSSKYAYVQFCMQSDVNCSLSGSIKVFGTTATSNVIVAPGITFATTTILGTNSAAPVVQSSFSLISMGGVSGNYIVTQSSPSNFSTTESTNVEFSFTYNVDTSSGIYSYVGFNLKDLTTGQSIDVSSATSSIISSGLASYSYTKTLTSGHMYSWTPYMKQTGGTLPTILGDSYTFWVVNRNSYQSQGPATVNPFATSTGFYNGWISSSTATSTGRVTYTLGNATTSCTTSFFSPSIEGALCSKFPFSYLYDFKVFLTELANGDGTNQGDITYTLPMGKTANGSSTVTLLSRTQQATSSPVTTARTLMEMGIYFTTALYVMGAIMTAI